jgi:hypothetical protein
MTNDGAIRCAHFGHAAVIHVDLRAIWRVNDLPVAGTLLHSGVRTRCIYRVNGSRPLSSAGLLPLRLPPELLPLTLALSLLLPPKPLPLARLRLRLCLRRRMLAGRLRLRLWRVPLDWRLIRRHRLVGTVVFTGICRRLLPDRSRGGRRLLVGSLLLRLLLRRRCLGFLFLLLVLVVAIQTRGGHQQ